MKLLFATISPSLLCTMHNNKIFPMALAKPRTNNINAHSIARLFASTTNTFEAKERRSANYHPTIWDPMLIASFTTPYNYELHANRLEELKNEVRSLLASAKEPFSLLKLIDSMQRLGIAYHFQEEIEESLNFLGGLSVATCDLYTTALHFRLLREHGVPVKSDVFDKFRYENGKFKDNLRDDIGGILSLYDASHVGMHGEDALEEAKSFCTKHIKSLLGRLQGNDIDLANHLQQALDVPPQWRMTRMEARNFVDFYEKDDTKNLVLIELAKLDYNLVQSIYQKELKELARWWRELGFTNKLQFSRDRLVENYLWAMGMIYEPHSSKCRIGLTKFVCILTAIDDMYDIYGSLDELELFTNVVNRWDIEAMEELPEYMKICYFAMFNFGNELAYDVMKKEELNILPYLKKAWTNLCEAYLVEARWYYGGYTPTLNEYLQNACISVGGPAAVVHSITLLEHHLSRDSLDCLKHASELIYYSSLITRLSDDLGTFTAESKRGDVTKAIQCYMIEKGASEEEAEVHIKGLISHSWKKLNEERSKCSLPKFVVDLSLNMARTARCIFQHGDGIGTSIGITRDRLTSLIVEPIPIE